MGMILTVLALLFSAADPGGWQAARWGMTPDQVLAAFPNQAKPNLSAKPFKGGLELVTIDQIQVGDYPMHVIFRFDEKTKLLTTVVLGTNRKEDVTERDFQALETLFLQKYGRPWHQDEPETSTSIWTFPTTTITLKRVQLRNIVFRSLWVAYEQKKSDAPI